MREARKAWAMARNVWMTDSRGRGGVWWGGGGGLNPIPFLCQIYHRGNQTKVALVEWLVVEGSLGSRPRLPPPLSPPSDSPEKIHGGGTHSWSQKDPQPYMRSSSSAWTVMMPTRIPVHCPPPLARAFARFSIVAAFFIVCGQLPCSVAAGMGMRAVISPHRIQFKN